MSPARKRLVTPVCKSLKCGACPGRTAIEAPKSFKDIDQHAVCSYRPSTSIPWKEGFSFALDCLSSSCPKPTHIEITQGTSTEANTNATLNWVNVLQTLMFGNTHVQDIGTRPVVKAYQQTSFTALALRRALSTKHWTNLLFGLTYPPCALGCSD